jgi:TolB-like protein/Flp pilus assembly protein TadD
LSLLTELKRRNVIRVGIAYVVLSWLILQMGDLLFDLMGLPEWALRIVLGILALGFIPALIFSWVYELTPDGVKRETEVDRTQSIAPNTGRRLDVTIIIVGLVCIGLFTADRSGLFGSRYTAVPGSISEPESAPEPAPAPQERVAPQPAVSRANAIAVLPFADLSQDGDQVYFADGIAEEILNLLARLPDLRVIARTSAFKFRGEDYDLREVGEMLNASHILEGSVRTAGKRVRITAQLIDSRTNLHLWSETYDRELDDIFAVQDEIAGEITRALGGELGVAPAHATPRSVADSEAYRLYLRGRKAWAERAEPGRMAEAIELLERSVAADPQLADAHGTLALAYTLSVYWTPARTLDVTAAALASAERALDLDPENVYALLAKGYVLGVHKLDDLAGEPFFLRALELRPNDVQAVNLTGDFYRAMCDGDKALFYERRAVELDPLDAVQLSDLAWAHFELSEWEAALSAARRAVALAPNTYEVHQAEIWSLVFLDRADEARARLDSIRAKGDYWLVRAAQDDLLLAMTTGDLALIRAQLRDSLAVMEANPSRIDPRMSLATIVGDYRAAAAAVRESLSKGDYSVLINSGFNGLMGRLKTAGIQIEFPDEVQHWADRSLQGEGGRWWIPDELAKAGYPVVTVEVGEAWD